MVSPVQFFKLAFMVIVKKKTRWLWMIYIPGIYIFVTAKTRGINAFSARKIHVSTLAKIQVLNSDATTHQEKILGDQPKSVILMTSTRIFFSKFVSPKTPENKPSAHGS